MKTLEAGKFIEQKGLEIVVILAVAVVALAGWLFYAYSWKAVDSNREAGLKDALLKEDALDAALSDLNGRAANLENLRRNRVNPPDIFR